MSVLAYHPGTQALAVLTDEQLVHMRAAGWVLQSEYEAAQEHAATQAAAQAAASQPAPSGKDK